MNDEKLDVLFINPPFSKLFEQRTQIGIPYGMLQIATVLKRNGLAAKVWDADFDENVVLGMKYSEIDAQDQSTFEKNLKTHEVWDKVTELIESTKPSILGIALNTVQYKLALRIAEIAKSIDENIYVVVGGVHATLLPEDTIKEKNFDFVVRGEGEYTMLELCNAIKNGSDFKAIKGITYRLGDEIISTENRPLIKNIDDVANPDKTLLLDYEKYPAYAFGLMISSRGCPNNCVYCAAKPLSGGMVRFRSPESLIEEMKTVYRVFKTREFIFVDDTFNINLDRALELCKKISDSGMDIMWSCNLRVNNVNEELIKQMKKSGCYRIHIGVESGNQSMLDKMKKGITLDMVRNTSKLAKKYDMELLAWFIIGHPDETEKTLLDTKNFIYEIEPDILRVALMVPFPKTEMGDRAVMENRLLTTEWEKYSGYWPVIRVDEFSEDELMNQLAELAEYSEKLHRTLRKRRWWRFSFMRNKVLGNIRNPKAILRFVRRTIEINLKRW